VCVAAIILTLSTGCVERRPKTTVDGKQSKVSLTLEEMIMEDQRLRSDTILPGDSVAAADRRHQETVFQMLSRGVISEPVDLFRASLLLQHADPTRCADCYLLAHHLAVEAVRRGLEEGRYVAAATLDRHLVFSNLPQRFGTQYNVDDSGYWSLYPIDTATTDSIRREWRVPPLDSILLDLEQKNSPKSDTAKQ
jgi:hypothetical protein